MITTEFVGREKTCNCTPEKQVTEVLIKKMIRFKFAKLYVVKKHVLVILFLNFL